MSSCVDSLFLVDLLYPGNQLLGQLDSLHWDTRGHGSVPWRPARDSQCPLEASPSRTPKQPQFRDFPHSVGSNVWYLSGMRAQSSGTDRLHGHVCRGGWKYEGWKEKGAGLTKDALPQ